jgi:hypothetical protein
MTHSTNQLDAENGGCSNPEWDIDRAIQVTTEMAAIIAKQTATRNKRDIRKQQSEEWNAKSKRLVDFRIHDPP